jgi:hypothetical protein
VNRVITAAHWARLVAHHVPKGHTQREVHHLAPFVLLGNITVL